MVKIRKAKQDDIDQLIALNKVWQYTDNNHDQKTAGFLMNALFNKADFKIIIDNKEIVTAEVNNRILPY